MSLEDILHPQQPAPTELANAIADADFIDVDNSDPPQLWLWRGEGETAEAWYPLTDNGEALLRMVQQVAARLTAAEEVIEAAEQYRLTNTIAAGKRLGLAREKYEATK